MNLDVSIIKDWIYAAFLWFKDFLGGPPVRYWLGFLLFMLLLLAGIVLFDVYIFLSLNETAFAPVDVSDRVKIDLVDRGNLESVSTFLKQQQEEFQLDLDIAMPPDPSL